MDRMIGFKTYPIGAGMAQPAERWDQLSRLVDHTPQPLLDMVSSPQTAAFIRGVAKTYNLPAEQGITIAYAVLRVALGELKLPQLAQVVAKETGLAQTPATALAQEIEKELFVPVMTELSRVVQPPAPRTPPASPPPNTAAGGARNVLDLKNKPNPPLPPAIPRQ